jgi:hypothetical protein
MKNKKEIKPGGRSYGREIEEYKECNKQNG